MTGANTSLDNAIRYRKALAAERRKQEYKADQAVRFRVTKKWVAKKRKELPAGVWRTMNALMRLCYNNKNNSDARVVCEPRIASVAKSLRVSEATVKRHTAELTRRGLIQKYHIPGRKRTRGKSCFAYYFCVQGALFARKAAEKDGLSSSATRAARRPPSVSVSVSVEAVRRAHQIGSLDEIEMSYVFLKDLRSFFPPKLNHGLPKGVLAYDVPHHHNPNYFEISGVVLSQPDIDRFRPPGSWCPLNVLDV
ncbi:MAG: hypothetical protein AAF224_08535 [Pseudomonadota bacterium]